jgi:DNA-binding GntR family transcriptional regulator
MSPTIVPRTAEEIAAGELRAAIVRGDLAPGEKIRQEESARGFGVSLIPLREALRRLASEGLLTYRPQRGYFVAEVGDETLAAMYQARSLIEGEVESLAVPAMRPEDIAALRRHLKDESRAAEDREAVPMIEANRGFHFTIFERCDNEWLLRFVAQLWDAVDPYRVLAYRQMWAVPDEQLVPTEILVEHEEILDALERRAPKTALRLLERHRSRSKAMLGALGAPRSA